jgi:hypothetical protein
MLVGQQESVSVYALMRHKSCLPEVPSRERDVMSRSAVRTQGSGVRQWSDGDVSGEGR